MRGGELSQLLKEVGDLLDQEGNLVRLTGPKAIFVGDTHGDLEATTTVIDKYLKENNQVVFLGDYVDRGPASRENIDFLPSTKSARFLHDNG